VELPSCDSLVDFSWLTDRLTLIDFEADGVNVTVTVSEAVRDVDELAECDIVEDGD